MIHPPPTTSALVLLSGGLDSTVLLAEAVLRRVRVEALTIYYGQSHAVELEAANAVATHFGVRHDVIDLGVLREHLASALTGVGSIPHGHYAAANMAATVVPNRNAIMLMVAAGIAAARKLDQVLVAVHSGDHPVYPDCRPEFVAAANLAAMLGTEAVSVDAPYMRVTKAEIVRRGQSLSAPVELSWSCYAGADGVTEWQSATHCGRCGTCVERAEAFHLAGVPDPTEYADTDFWRGKVGADA